MLTELHLFAGAGGGILGGHLLGHRCIGAVEIDPYCRSVLVARQRDGSLPYFPIFPDVTTFDGTPYRGRVDVLAGGFPCQAYSSAARGRNTADDLWPEMARIVADVAPRYVFAENVARAAIDGAADDLETMGYQVRAVPLAASDLGADHIRQRYWLLGYAHRDSESRREVNDETSWVPSICQSVWQDEPWCLRVPDGMAGRVERLTALGNSQIPVVAAAAFAILRREF